MLSVKNFRKLLRLIFKIQSKNLEQEKFKILRNNLSHFKQRFLIQKNTIQCSKLAYALFNIKENSRFVLSKNTDLVQCNPGITNLDIEEVLSKIYSQLQNTLNQSELDKKNMQPMLDAGKHTTASKRGKKRTHVPLLRAGKQSVFVPLFVHVA